jgi:hypothetical protein
MWKKVEELPYAAFVIMILMHCTRTDVTVLGTYRTELWCCWKLVILQDPTAWVLTSLVVRVSDY